MIYIFLEGKVNGSEYTFWQYINKELYNNKLNIIGCGGSLNVLNTIKSTKLSKKDLGIVYIDKNWEQEDDPLRELINDLIIYCNLEDNLFLCANTAGFEDILLNFSYLQTYLYCIPFRNSAQVKNIWSDYQKYLTNWKEITLPDKDENHNDITEKITKFFEKRNKIATKEKVAYIILNALVKIIPNNGFSVLKGNLGQC